MWTPCEDTHILCLGIFPPKIDTYRIGGDKYVAFAVEVNTEVLAERPNLFLEQIQKRQYHVSMGFESRATGQIDMRTLVAM